MKTKTKRSARVRFVPKWIPVVKEALRTKNPREMINMTRDFLEQGKPPPSAFMLTVENLCYSDPVVFKCREAFDGMLNRVSEARHAAIMGKGHPPRNLRQGVVVARFRKVLGALEKALDCSLQKRDRDLKAIKRTLAMVKNSHSAHR